jgi:hypothetical protein
LIAPLTLCLFGASLSAEPLRLVHEIDAEDSLGAPFPPEAGVRLELRADGRGALGWTKGSRTLPDATNVSFGRDAAGAQRVYAIDPRVGELLVLRVSGSVVASETRRLRELVGLDAAGITVDAAGDRLFVLEASRGRIVVINGFLRGARRRMDEIPLPANPPPLRGLAFDPATGHLHALAPATGELLEIGPDGTLLAVRQFLEAAREVRAIAFAPSTDRTDDPSVQHLFAAAPNPSGGTTLELALEPLALAAATTVPATLLQTILTSAFTPPSPDPSGIELLGPNGPLLISDGEVEETVSGITLYRGVNLWEVNLNGTVASTSDTTFFSDEPTGAAVNPANGHVFLSDDTGTQSVYEVTLGSDGKVSVGDTVRQIKVSNYGPIDCEGVAFGGGSLWIAAGSDAEVYRISPGPNGSFDGGGDDVVSHFDTNSIGLTDTEGIAYDSDGGNVYVAGPAQDNLIGHFSATGQLLRWIDISAASPKNPAGLAYGPSPAGGPTRRLYLVARGTDNNSDPRENDGKLFVFSVNPLGGGSSNQAPFVSAGNDLSVDLAASASLDGTVSDDNLPSGTLTTTWSPLSGPGTVNFGNVNAVDTTATFSLAGTYVVQLLAFDGQLSSSDTATITVTSSGGGGSTTIDKRVAAGADDAEQASSGSVDTGSSDLELVTDGTSVQTVGMRFSGLAIPQGAAIQSAWIQFQADETSTVATTLTIQGEDSDNAVPFTTGANNVGARPRTSASAVWSPPAWNLVGEAGERQQTPDLSAVVRQIVSRGGWQSGNALAIVITGSGSRVAESFDGGSPAALLHVVFGGAVGNQAPLVSAGPDRNINLGQTASLDGTVSDDAQLNPTPTTTWTKTSGPALVGFANESAVDTTASFTVAGNYVLRLTAFDGQLSAQDEMSVSVVDPTAGGVVDRRISAATDDAEERIATGAIDLASSDLEFALDGNNPQWIGMRFQNLPIPAGATIRNAWIQFQADEAWSIPTSVTIQGELNPNPATFTTAAFGISSRTRTSTTVPWTPPAWNTVGEEGDPQKTPSLTAIVQALVSQQGWNAGNAMVFIATGSGTRTAESFDGGSPPALLHIEY